MEIIIGSFVSLLVEAIKKRFGVTGWTTRFILLALAVVGAGVYTMLIKVGYWEVIAKVLITAGAFYAFVIRALKE